MALSLLVYRPRWSTTETILVEEMKGQPTSSSIEEAVIHYPIFVASLFKSGTTSVHDYFDCGQRRSVHNRLDGRRTIGGCMSLAVRVRDWQCGGTWW